jgi:hypothetical protein
MSRLMLGFALATRFALELVLVFIALWYPGSTSMVPPQSAGVSRSGQRLF